MIGPLSRLPVAAVPGGATALAGAGEGFAALLADLGVPAGGMAGAGDPVPAEVETAERGTEDADPEAVWVPGPAGPLPEALLALVTHTPASPPVPVDKTASPAEPAKTLRDQPGRDTPLPDKAAFASPPAETTVPSPLPPAPALAVLAAVPLTDQVVRATHQPQPGTRGPDPGVRAAFSAGQPNDTALPDSEAVAPPPLPSMKDMVPVMPRLLPDPSPPPVRDGAAPVREAGVSPAPPAPLPLVPIVAPPHDPMAGAPPPPSQPAVSALAGQLAAALPRLRRDGGEAVLTLEPARLGRVTLAWQADTAGPAVLTVRAVEPATAALLTRLGDDLAALLRADMVGGGQPGQEFRLDIGRAERAPDPRQPEPRPGDGAGQGMMADGGGAGQSRHSPRPGAAQPGGTESPARAAVSDDDMQDSSVGHSVRMDRAARLA